MSAKAELRLSIFGGGCFAASGKRNTIKNILLLF
jgi:hypothetical protein